MFPPIFPARDRRARYLSGADPIPSNPRSKAGLRAAEKKARLAGEPASAPGVDWVAPGEAPQPLTLNHPALKTGRLKRPEFN
jgi:hypothetical protein